VHRGGLADDLLALGVRPGGVLLVHASLRALGHVPGGAEAVIRALLAALGDGGTLLMPALTYERVTPESPVFDVNHTPANVGVLAETFRRRAGTRRSVHPTHSVCAVGPLTAALLDPHLEDSTPCGPHSPFRALPEHDGQILMLGCGLEPNTSMHAIEEQVVPPYLYGPPIEYLLTLADGAVIRKTYTPHGFRGWSQRYERVAHLLAAPALRVGTALSAEAHLIEAAALWQAAVPALRHDPLCFVEPQG
jgi:aminoglycoside 3-N-acetyltransferase